MIVLKLVKSRLTKHGSLFLSPKMLRRFRVTAAPTKSIWKEYIKVRPIESAVSKEVKVRTVNLKKKLRALGYSEDQLRGYSEARLEDMLNSRLNRDIERSAMQLKGTYRGELLLHEGVLPDWQWDRAIREALQGAEPKTPMARARRDILKFLVEKIRNGERNRFIHKMPDLKNEIYRTVKENNLGPADVDQLVRFAKDVVWYI